MNGDLEIKIIKKMETSYKLNLCQRWWFRINTNICKIGKGIDDNDFKDDWVGNQRAQCAARYIADSFLVPLVKTGTINHRC